MEVEVKLRLGNADAHRHVTTLLSPFHVMTHRQHNLFFDGAASELSSRRAVLRLRFYDDDKRCVVSLKAKAVLVDGVSRVEEDEEDLDPKVGRDCVAEPGKLGLVESRILGRVRDEFGVVGEMGFADLGGFRIVRTDFDFGTLHGGAGHWHDRGWRWICRSCYGGTKVKRGAQGQKAKRGKVVKGDFVCVGASQKKILADITNLDQHQEAKQHPAPLAAPATDISD